VLERQLCAGCVDAFFAELETSRLDALSGVFTGAADSGSPRTLGGVVAGKPFLVQVAGVRLALFAALKGRLLDLAAYRGCSDPSALLTFDVETSLAAPDSVVAGREFEVRAEIAAGDEPVFGVVAALEVEGALAAGGARTFSGNLDPLEPQQFAARFRVPETVNVSKTPPPLATARLTVAVERGFLRQGGERAHPIRILAPRLPPSGGGPARR
jgi:hypothetical protein